MVFTISKLQWPHVLPSFPTSITKECCRAELSISECVRLCDAHMAVYGLYLWRWEGHMYEIRPT